jgi:uncharacterized repeat protein (TIGR01451 family)
VTSTANSTLLSWYARLLPAQSSGVILLTVNLANRDTPLLITNTLDIESATAEVNATDNHSVLPTTVQPVQPAGVSVQTPSSCTINKACVITGTVSPANASLPITFTWNATGQSPVTVKVYGIVSTVVFTFTTGGTESINVQATNSGGTGNGSGSVTVPQAELALDKAGPASVTAGGVIQYTLTFTNTGPTDASDITITDHLPTAVAFGGIVSLPGGFSLTGPSASNVLTFMAGTLASDGVSHSIVFTAVVTNVNPPATIVNTAQITSTTLDTGAFQKTDQVSTSVNKVNLTSVTITAPGSCTRNSMCTVTANTLPLNATLPITYSWSATNATPGSATRTVNSVSDSLGLTFTVTGTQYVTVTATGSGSSRTDSATVNVP